MGLTDILTTFKSFFSRSFWFGSFLPVAIFTGIHLVIAWWVGTGLELSTIISADTGKLITVPLALFALIVLAYAATPLIPLVQGLLDGSLLPQSVHGWLRRRHLVEARAARRRVDEATAEFNKMGELSFTTTRDLQNARNKGNEQRAFPVPREVERAAAEIGSLRTAFDRGTPPAHDDLKTAADGLTVILRRSRTSVDKELKAVKDTADKLIETMTELLGQQRQRRRSCRRRATTGIRMARRRGWFPGRWGFQECRGGNQRFAHGCRERRVSCTCFAPSRCGQTCGDPEGVQDRRR